jgi:hypothetical protein
MISRDQYLLRHENKRGRIAKFKSDGPFLFWAQPLFGSIGKFYLEILIPAEEIFNS